MKTAKKMNFPREKLDLRYMIATFAKFNVVPMKSWVETNFYSTLIAESNGYFYFTAEHKRIHITGDVKCEVCKIRFTVKSLRYHLKRFHPEIVMPKFTQNVQFKCSMCKIICSDAKRLGEP